MRQCDQLMSLLESLRKLYIMTEYHNLILLFLNLGCVVNLTQSFLITFFRVSQQLRVARPLSLANYLMLLPMMSSIPYFSNALSWYQIILNFRYICHSKNLRLKNQKGKQLNLNIQKFPRMNHGSIQGYNFRRVILAKTHRQILKIVLGMLSVNKFTILLKVSTPVMKSPPPRNYSTLMSYSELKLRQSRCLSISSMTSKKPSLKNSYLLNSKGSILSCLLITSVSLSMRNLWLSNCTCSYRQMRWSQAVSKRQKEGTALGQSQRMIGRESYAKGTTRMTEYGMNLIMSILILCDSASSYPVSSQETLFLYKLVIHLISFQRSLDPCTMVYFASFRINLVFRRSVFSRSVKSFFLSYYIWWWLRRLHLLRWVRRRCA